MPIPVDVRLLAATNKDLEAEIAKGNFREDLYYRVKVIHVHMPPLREIREEVPLLANHFLKEYCRETNHEPLEFSSGVLRKLSVAGWPGNVRQLRNEVMRLAACARGKTITEDDLFEGVPLTQAPAPPAAAAAAAGAGAKAGRVSLKQAVEELEARMIAEALESTRNNQLQAAKQLGLSRQGLINKMKRYELG
jgi:DNA-binding NtrC family response regulator